MERENVGIIAWHPELTAHQSYTYSELHNLARSSFAIRVLRIQSDIRQEQGWKKDHLMRSATFLLPEKNYFKHVATFLEETKSQTHIFGSVFESPKLLWALFLATRKGIRCYLISEPYSISKEGYFNDKHSVLNYIKLILRPWLYKLYMMLFSKSIEGIFTISELAGTQFQSAGLPKYKCYPFGYFVPVNTALASDKPPSVQQKNTLKLICIGSLIRRKGLDILVNVVKQFNQTSIEIELDLYGPGDVKSNLLGNGITYRGIIPFEETGPIIQKYDFLILPSRYDGWGVVINESICAGVPVICSKNVGAKVLVEKFNAGMVFKDEQELIKLLKILSNSPNKVRTLKNNAKDAIKFIQPREAAIYLHRIITSNAGVAKNIKPIWDNEDESPRH